MQMKFCSCLPSRGELFKTGFSAKFEFRSDILKRKLSLICFVYNLIIGCSKMKRENYPIKVLLISGG